VQTQWEQLITLCLQALKMLSAQPHAFFPDKLDGRLQRAIIICFPSFRLRRDYSAVWVRRLHTTESVYTVESSSSSPSAFSRVFHLDRLRAGERRDLVAIGCSSDIAPR
jgi:hypothetical protein